MSLGGNEIQGIETTPSEFRFSLTRSSPLELPGTAETGRFKVTLAGIQSNQILRGKDGEPQPIYTAQVKFELLDLNEGVLIDLEADTEISLVLWNAREMRNLNLGRVGTISRDTVEIIFPDH